MDEIRYRRLCVLVVCILAFVMTVLSFASGVGL